MVVVSATTKNAYTPAGKSTNIFGKCYPNVITGLFTHILVSPSFTLLLCVFEDNHNRLNNKVQPLTECFLPDHGEIYCPKMCYIYTYTLVF